ncbi:hypothetical protein SEA_PHAYONCE_40 [Mycobacterium phage Phayonce]|uniref:DUF732 domain-containing protein n=1 Tax=Mycobacterium phage Phayonce TaxID=1647302 RepID=A0A0F6WE36_9CAUD|nr:hypothetical protein SEA_PHAYONCE_40 [Mycobacterium phage Phayonce]AKF14400.1 hypothetical protein SEA_PHAYONCE_40 [Mycobacterium phage Phayonce]
MSNNSVPNNTRPIWTPADARRAAEDAKRHKPVRLRDWVWAPVLIMVGILGVGLLTGCSSTVEGTPTAASGPVSAPTEVAPPPMTEEELTDRAFIMTLDEGEIPYVTEEGAIEGGHLVCDLLAEVDGNVFTAALAIASADDSPLTTDQSAYLVGAASAAYCPEYVAGLVGN